MIDTFGDEMLLRSLAAAAINVKSITAEIGDDAFVTLNHISKSFFVNIKLCYN